MINGLEYIFLVLFSILSTAVITCYLAVKVDDKYRDNMHILLVAFGGVMAIFAWFMFWIWVAGLP